jgi:glycosyltransferase involved in cell wall biosynthesis
MTEIKFSIAIPAYKVDFLAACIDSILNQTYTNFELIILDDKSPYDVPAIVSQFNDPRITFLQNEVNVGAEKLVNNWNYCLHQSEGDFFMMMGDDDTLEPDYLEEFLKLINKYPALDVYHCRANIIDNTGRKYMLSSLCPEFESVYDNIWHRITERRMQYISDFVYRSSALKAAGGFYYMPLAWGSDDVTAYIAAGQKGIAYTSKPVFNYRSHGSTITSTGQIDLKLSAHQYYEQWLKTFLQQKPANPADMVMYQELVNNSAGYLKKRNTNALAKSLTGNLNASIKLFTVYKKYNMSFTDVAFVVFNGLRKTLKAKSN